MINLSRSKKPSSNREVLETHIELALRVAPLPMGK